MKRPEKLDDWDLDCIQVPDGWDMKDVPDLTRDNMKKVIDAQNNLLELVNKLADKYGVVFDDE